MEIPALLILCRNNSNDEVNIAQQMKKLLLETCNTANQPLNEINERHPNENDDF